MADSLNASVETYRWNGQRHKDEEYDDGGGAVLSGLLEDCR